MKKLVLALACLSLAGTALADKSIRVINNDKFAGMTVQSQTCIMKFNNSKDIQCVDNKPTYIASLHEEEQGQGQHAVSISIPNDPEGAVSLLSIISVSAVNKESGKEEATGKFSFGPNKGQCSGDITGDTIVLDPYGTDIVSCNYRNFGVANK